MGVFAINGKLRQSVWMNLIELDHRVFHFFNSDFTNPVFDAVFPFITDLQKNLPVVGVAIAILMAALVFCYRWKGIRILLALAFALGATDYINYHFIKGSVERPRPEFAGMNPVLRTHSHSGTSFPSNHAANITACAVFLGFWFRRGRYFFYLYAFLVCYSRVYVGVHFPLDVLGGSVVGYSIAQITQSIFKMIELKYFVKKSPVPID